MDRRAPSTARAEEALGVRAEGTDGEQNAYVLFLTPARIAEDIMVPIYI
jgi:hypothetical protein